MVYEKRRDPSPIYVYDMGKTAKGWEMKIAVYAQRDFWEDFAQVLQAHEVEFVDPDARGLLSALREFDAMRFERFVIMDEAVGDREILDALGSFVNEPRAERSNMEPAFVSNAFREQPSGFYRTLVMELGITQVIARAEGDGDYDYFGDLVKSLRYPLRRSDVTRLCASPEPQAPVETPVPSKPEPQARPALVDYRKTTRIVFAQPDRKNGSTHTAYACAAALRVLGHKVALVVSEAHANKIRQIYPSVPFDAEAGCIMLADIPVYIGDSPTAVPDGFDYVLCDQGLAFWLFDHGDIRNKAVAEAQLDVYNHADHRIMCSFVAPIGAWEFGYELIERMGARSMSITTFSVFGAPTPEFEERIRMRIASLSERARFVAMPCVTAPLFMARPADVPAAVAEILRPVLSGRDRDALDVRNQAVEPEPEQGSGSSPLRRLFRRKETHG